ncbi:hypothetical protein AMECASPLE_031683 [Ameca splendens]|uniref:Uncharacterized protein n=1 Tax=Ameca splendens TaxID=208324 RepID=A0ABV1A4V5_9TELE
MAESSEWITGLLFHSVGEIQRVLKTAVVLGEQVVQQTRSKMDSLVSGMGASRGNVIQVTMEVLVMAEVSSKENMHVGTGTSVISVTVNTQASVTSFLLLLCCQ